MTRISFRPLNWLINTWRYRYTQTGRVLLGGVLFSGAVGSLMLNMPVYHLFCGLFFLFFMAIIGGIVLRPRVTIKGALPEKVCAGRPFSTEFTIENRSRLPSYDVGLAFLQEPKFVRQEPSPALPRLGGHGTARLSLRMRPLRRGIYTLSDLCAVTTFPFNLRRAVGAREFAGALFVLPDFHPIGNLAIPLGLRYQPGGVALTSNIGESPEYIGNRLFQHGDNPRRIDHQSWARLTQPVVREYQEEYYCRIALVLDTFVAKGQREGPEGFPSLEAGVSLCAAIADSLTRGEQVIDIFAAGPELYVFRAGRSIAHFDNVLEILACVEACRENPFDIISPALHDELGNITSVVYVMLDWDEAREGFVRVATESGCSTRVFIVRDKPTSMDFTPAETWAGPIVQLPPAAIKRGSLTLP